jgi:hypothetical protein
MSTSFTKLFSTITESTIWGERDPIRLTWITMMAMADRKGRVFGSLPGLAHRARVSLEDALEAIEKFQKPDQFSRTREHDGKRIELIDGGWRLLNYSKYREMRDEEASKEAKREYINDRRESEKAAEEATGKKQSKFQKPTPEQCRLYAAKIGLSEEESEKFHNFYESKGWKVGKNPMASWPHAMSGWKSRAAEYSSEKSNGSPTIKKTHAQILEESQL